MRLTGLCLLCALTASASPALATSSLECQGVDNEDVSLLLTLGSVPVLAVVGAHISTPTETFSMRAEGGETSILVGQGFQDTDSLMVDFVDDNVEAVLVSLRLARAEGDKQLVEAGVLTVRQTEAYAVNCFS
ncbi:MAG: hypothetical protein KI785_10620 [Devosiaceae bacterium]|nr:hypothetical protein [Devosiaceae bacterium MH13]